MKSALEYPLAKSRSPKNRPRQKRESSLPPRKAITRILVPIDLSRASFKAISYAVAIARRFGAEVHLLHVIDTTQLLPPTVLMWPVVTEQKWKARVERELQCIALKYSEGLEITAHPPLEGCPHEQICQAARRLKADVIIIATHGYTGYKRAFLGSTAERVVQFSHCPVLVVRKPYSTSNGANGDGPRTNFYVDKILIPVDFSAFSAVALDLGLALARDLGAKVSLFHVVKTPLYPLGDQYVALPAGRFVEAARKAARKEMQAMAAKAKVEVSTQVAEGSPPATICDRASKEHFGLIIMSTHGRSGFRHELLGSVAERVVRHADCPVLTVPARWATRN